MTALDDFVAEHDRPLRRVVLPVYFGLAIVVEEAALERSPELARAARPARERGEGRRAARARARRSASRRWSYQHNDRLAARAEARAGAPSGTSTCSRARCSTSTTSRTSSASSTSPRCVERGTPVDPAIAPRPDAPPARGTPAPRRRGSGRARRRTTTRHRRTSRTPRWAAPGSTTSQRCLETIVARDRRRRPRRVRHRPRRRGDLPARLPRRARDARPPGVGRRPVPRLDRPDRRRRDRRVAGFGRPQPRPRRLRALRPARRPGPLPAGPARRHACADAPIDELALLRIGDDLGGALGDALDALYDRVAVGGIVVVDESRRRRVARAIEDVPGPATASPSRSSGSTGLRSYWRKVGPRDAVRVGRTHAARCRSRRAALPGRDAVDAPRPLGRRRLLQHAARGGAHAALAVPRVPARHRRPRLRGHRRRERLGPGPAARRRASSAASVPSSATSTSATTRRRRRSTRSTAASRSASGDAFALDDRRRARPHAGRPPLRHGRARAPTRRRSSPPSSGTSGPGQQGDAMERPATTRTTRTGCSTEIDWPRRRLPAVRDRPLHRRPRLVRRRLGEQLPVRAAQGCSSRSAASTRASRCRAAATRTSSSTSGSASTPGVTRRHDHRRGLVPPGARRHHDQPGGRRRAASPRVRLRAALRRAPGPPVPRPEASCTTWGACRHGAARTKPRRRAIPNRVQGRPRRPRRPLARARCRSPTSSRRSSSTPSGTVTPGRTRPGSGGRWPGPRPT